LDDVRRCQGANGEQAKRLRKKKIIADKDSDEDMPNIGGSLDTQQSKVNTYPTLPHPTLPPYPTLPYPTLPYSTLPYPTIQAASDSDKGMSDNDGSLDTQQSKVNTYPTLPYPTLPYPTLPYHAGGSR
jgi:hypothetical protein